MYRPRSFVSLSPHPDNLYGLIVGWSFDDGSGSDFSGWGQEGQLSGGPVIGEGIVAGLGGPAGGLLFDGSNDYVLAPRLFNAPLVTVAVWVKINGNPGAQGQIVSFVNGLGSATADKSLVCTTGGVASWYVFDGAVKTVTGSTVITDNQWHHLAAVADGTNSILYVDGVYENSAAAGLTFSGYTVPNIFANGTNAGGAAATYLACTLDDVRVYDRPQTPGSVHALYSRGLAAISEQEWPAIIVPAAATFRRNANMIGGLLPMYGGLQ